MFIMLTALTSFYSYSVCFMVLVQNFFFARSDRATGTTLVFLYTTQALRSYQKSDIHLGLLSHDAIPFCMVILPVLLLYALGAVSFRYFLMSISLL